MNTKIRSLAFTSLSHFSVDGKALLFLGLKFFKRRDYQIKSPVIQKQPGSSVSIKGAIPAFLVMLVVIVFLRSMFIMSINTYIPSYLVGLILSVIELWRLC